MSESSAETGRNLFEHVTATFVDAPTETVELPDRRTPLDIARERIAESRDSAKQTRATRRKTARTKTVPPSKEGEFIQPIAEFYSVVGMAISVYDIRTGHIHMDDKGNLVTPCGVAVVENAEKIATAWDDLAQRNPAVRKMLRSFVSVSVTGQLVAAHAPIAMAIFNAHVIGSNNDSPLPPDIKADE